MTEQTTGVALVTGATRNIGRSIAVGLAEDGYDILMMARTKGEGSDRTIEEVERRGRRALLWTADVRDQDAVLAGVDRGREELGPLSVLVNNAAVRRERDFLDIDRMDWDEVVDVVLGGAFVCSQAALPDMVERGWGRIVNIAGVTGQTGAARRAHVVTAKAGIVGLTKALAHEYAASGVTVNAVSPGLIDTVRDHVPEPHRGKNVPVGRTGGVTEVAAAVRYLVGADAGFVTGQTLNVNGGIHMV
ncbi:SDR family NAD(P)-dependent oxidoreductase [Nocardiopsis sp. MG754419]|uniref:SDR family NAD(P)-dependent oxidoreductase n=1 Tax=Nocardiopsis sp. MG754419 TaxID=2259865 RepID=UPI001BA51F8F|nr:SDR family NAD(P)-dependent oxidoreductase [Nocardiopsis sp. MG754419]MBR8741795.1 short-chain dehydrogenase [Nocardiopsis sp. MG754419]